MPSTYSVRLIVDLCNGISRRDASLRSNVIARLNGLKVYLHDGVAALDFFAGRDGANDHPDRDHSHGQVLGQLVPAAEVIHPS